jgi:regulation of enolase protein 1 (concanavalin A-like superfamily)
MRRSTPGRRSNTKGLLLFLLLAIALYPLSRKIAQPAEVAVPARAVPAEPAAQAVLPPPPPEPGVDWAPPGVAAQLAMDKNRIAGWGRAINLSADSVFLAEGGRLTIAVPGTEQPHGLSSELGSASAPLAVQPVKGDFVITVKVDGRFQPGDVATERQRSAYMGAGLVVFADASNYVTLVRAALQWPGEQPQPYINFEIRVDGQLEKFGQTGDFPLDPDQPVWLRLERKGDQMLGAMSQDGVTWTYGQPKQLRNESWNQNAMLAGVAAISNSLAPFTPSYTDLAVQPAAK